MDRNQHEVYGHKPDGTTDLLGEKLSWAEMKKLVYEPREGYVQVTGNFKGEAPKMRNPSPQAGLPPKPAPALTQKGKSKG